MNLLSETIEILENNNKTFDDVLWVGDSTGYMTTLSFIQYSDFEYYNGYGLAEVNISLRVVGEDFWLERYEYDGLENWEYKQLPNKPNEEKDHSMIKGDM